MQNKAISARALSMDLRITDVQYDDTTKMVVWREERGGKGVLVAQHGKDAFRDLTDELTVRAGVGYGGGEFGVGQGCVYFVATDGRLYKQRFSGGDSRALTPAFGNACSPKVSADGHWVAYMHTYEDKDVLAVVDAEGKHWPRRLFGEADFVMQPAWSPKGDMLAMVTWQYSHMPWDETSLYLVSWPEAKPEKFIAEPGVSIFQPEFSPEGRFLSYVSDKTGWQQLYVYDFESKEHLQITDVPAEHGLPGWIQGMRTYCWDNNGIYFLRSSEGQDTVWYWNQHDKKTSPLKGWEQYTSIRQPSLSENGLIAIASAPHIPERIVNITKDGSEYIYRRSSTEKNIATEKPKVLPVSWQGHDGETVYGLYSPPTNDAKLPPLIVEVHGGPTSQRKMNYSGLVRFFTERGFAFLQVNYRGSTGYGKKYMNKLNGQWGIYDVEDSASGASYLVSQGLADKEKLIIMGGSAGGFSVLYSLICKPGFYKAGICCYGVSNHFMLVADTHKFERYYLDSLLGTLPSKASVYRERSPIFHADKIVDPIAIFQGTEDKVVPKDQSDSIVKSLQARDVPHEYHVYEGEGHGWRNPKTIEEYLNSVIKFLQQYVIYN